MPDSTTSNSASGRISRLKKQEQEDRATHNKTTGFGLEAMGLLDRSEGARKTTARVIGVVFKVVRSRRVLHLLLRYLVRRLFGVRRGQRVRVLGHVDWFPEVLQQRWGRAL